MRNGLFFITTATIRGIDIDGMFGAMKLLPALRRDDLPDRIAAPFGSE